MLRLGKEHVFVLELDPDDVHEDEAGIRLGKAFAGTNVECRGPQESRVNLFATKSGLLKIDINALDTINELPNVILATLPNNSVVKQGEMIAGTKVIPLVVKESVIIAAEEITQQAGEVIKVVPFKNKKAGIIVTGNEVYIGRIEDAFAPVLRQKIETYHSEILEVAYTPDDALVISETITKMLAKGADLILVSGGMSVDPDDVTPVGIEKSGAEIIEYGAPALPGGMFLMAYHGDIPVMGVPACGMYFKTTILDVLLPRLLVDEKISKKDIIKLANGGLCRSCEACNYPNCSFAMGTSL